MNAMRVEGLASGRSRLLFLLAVTCSALLSGEGGAEEWSAGETAPVAITDGVRAGPDVGAGEEKPEPFASDPAKLDPAKLDPVKLDAVKLDALGKNPAVAALAVGAPGVFDNALDRPEPALGGERGPLGEIGNGILTDALCALLASAAEAHGLPLEFFARVIWQESRFRADAIGPVTRTGHRAQGIAQFMPYTATVRGLHDPFDPQIALFKSAEFLAELHDEFGNFGLAAAAYNAGPGRVRNFIEKGGSLPGQTRHYVRAITGRPIEEWVALRQQGGKDGVLRPTSCAQVAGLVKEPPYFVIGAAERRVRAAALHSPAVAEWPKTLPAQTGPNTAALNRSRLPALAIRIPLPRPKALALAQKQPSRTPALPGAGKVLRLASVAAVPRPAKAGSEQSAGKAKAPLGVARVKPAAAAATKTAALQDQRNPGGKAARPAPKETVAKPLRIDAPAAKKSLPTKPKPDAIAKSAPPAASGKSKQVASLAPPPRAAAAARTIAKPAAEPTRKASAEQVLKASEERIKKLMIICRGC